MNNDIVNYAIQAVLNSEMSYCKFLSANDTGATGGHQSGILISKSAMEMMFSTQEIAKERIPKKSVKIKWQNDIETESTFTWYESKNELRITRFGKGFPYLLPEQTGSLFVFVKNDATEYSAYFLDIEDDIEDFLDTFGLSPTETNRMINKAEVSDKKKEQLEIQNFIDNLDVDFPPSEVMSAAARKIENAVNDHKEYIVTHPDAKIISWTEMEYTLFRELERARYGNIISKGFSSVDEFVKIANVVLNRRKSRAGKSLEHHLAAVFDENEIGYSAQPVTEGHKKPDFLFPSQEAYLDPNFSEKRLVSLAAKTTCKDRWRQVLNEANRLRNRPKYLCTLQQGISGAQMDEMQAENVILVVPKPYIATYPKDRRNRIWTVAKFIKYVKELEGN